MLKSTVSIELLISERLMDYHGFYFCLLFILKNEKNSFFFLIRVEYGCLRSSLGLQHGCCFSTLSPWRHLKPRIWENFWDEAGFIAKISAATEVGSGGRREDIRLSAHSTEVTIWDVMSFSEISVILESGVFVFERTIAWFLILNFEGLGHYIN